MEVQTMNDQNHNKKTISQCVKQAQFPGIDVFVDLASEMHALIAESRYGSDSIGQFLSWVLDELTVQVEQIKAHPGEIERLSGIANLAFFAAALAHGGVAPEILPWEAEALGDFIARDDENLFENGLQEREHVVERCYEKSFRGDGDDHARLFLRGYLEALADVEDWMASGQWRPVDSLREVLQREVRR
jgi:hypothetical protein